MSLLSSIFGEAPGTASAKKVDTSQPDLFDTKVSVPPPLHKQSASSTEKKGKGEQSSSSDDAPSSAEQSTPDDVNVEAKNNTPGKNTPKKTKEELEEEEGRTIFVGNLPPDISRRALAGIFKSCGNVVSARLRSVAVAGVKLPPEYAGNQVRYDVLFLCIQFRVLAMYVCFGACT